MTSYFDQRGQRVNRQVNVVGKVARIDFGADTGIAELIGGLRSLNELLTEESTAGSIDTEIASAARTEISSAILALDSPEPDSRRANKFLRRARSLLRGVAAAAGFVSAIGDAIEALRRIF
jgi:hypothetical protein